MTGLPCPVCGKRPGEQGRGWRLPHADESGTGNGIRRCEGCNPAAPGKRDRPARGGTGEGRSS
jgi:hypothetical protein